MKQLLITFSFVAVFIPITSNALARSLQLPFRAASALLLSEENAALDRFAQAPLKDNECFILRDRGKPTSSYYLLLSEARLLVAFKELVDRGVDPGRIRFRPHSLPGEANEAENVMPPKPYVLIESWVPKKGKGCENNRPLEGGDTADGSEVVFSFSHRSSAPDPINEKALAGFAKAQKQNRSGKIHIEGHADNQGPASYNLLLSKVRALKIYKKMVWAGIDGKSIEVSYFGNKNSVASAHNVEAFKKNRRVGIRRVEPGQDTATNNKQETVEKKSSTPSESKQEINTQTSAKEDDDEPEKPLTLWNVFAFGGYASAPSDLRSNVKNTTLLGLGVNREEIFTLWRPWDAETSFTQESLSSKTEGIDGTIKILGARLGVATKLMQTFAHPTFHLGLTYLKWSGSSEQVMSGNTQDESGSSVGTYVGAGSLWFLTKHLYAEPLLEGQYATTGVGGISYNLLLILGWKI